MVRGILAALGAAAQRPFGTHACTEDDGLRTCRGPLVPTWDGVLLDADVLLPAAERPPLVVLLGGYPGGVVPLDRGPVGLLPDPRALARRGFAVLAVAPRGTYRSCGYRDTSLTPACARGWSHVADSRYEARDVQHLAGLLADQGLVGDRIGVAGESYGGGTALQLAVLRDRVRLPDGRLEPWRSPGGRAMRIGAVAGLTTWDDLGYGLAPNGRLGVDTAADPAAGRRPAGIPLAGLFSGFIGLGVTGFPNPAAPEPLVFRTAPPGADPGSDLLGWYAALMGDAPVAAEAALDELTANHSAAGLAIDRRPAPTFLASGVTDDLFPASHALRHAARADREPGAQMSVLLADVGHGRATSPREHLAHVHARTEDWLRRWLADADVEAAPAVEALPAACSGGGPAVRGASLGALADDVLRVEDATARTLTATPDRHGPVLDPLAASSVPGVDRCALVDADDRPGTAAYAFAPVEAPVLVAGAPVVSFTAAGPGQQLAARLWDVDPSGRQRLVTRALLRPVAGRNRLELHPTAWTLAAGHRLRLELLGADAPYGRPAPAGGALTVSEVRAAVPIRR